MFKNLIQALKQDNKAKREFMLDVLHTKSKVAYYRFLSMITFGLYDSVWLSLYSQDLDNYKLMHPRWYKEITTKRTKPCGLPNIPIDHTPKMPMVKPPKFLFDRPRKQGRDEIVIERDYTKRPPPE